jgi:hypothetical protein
VWSRKKKRNIHSIYISGSVSSRKLNSNEDAIAITPIFRISIFKLSSISLLNRNTISRKAIENITAKKIKRNQ